MRYDCESGGLAGRPMKNLSGGVRTPNSLVILSSVFLRFACFGREQRFAIGVLFTGCRSGSRRIER